VRVGHALCTAITTIASYDDEVTNAENPDSPTSVFSRPVVQTRPVLTLLCLLLTDIAALVMAAGASVLLRYIFGGQFEFATYARLAPMLLVFITAFTLVGLYQGTALNPVEELRLLSTTTTLVYLFLAVASFLFQSGEVYSRIVFLVAWILSLFALPLARALAREVFAHQVWWGFPVVILGANETAALAIETLRRQVGLGLTPVGVLDEQSSQKELNGVPILGKLELIPNLTKQWGVKHAMIAMPNASRLASPVYGLPLETSAAYWDSRFAKTFYTQPRDY
jgi:FlaA1/EpsC-like NDP-sugar epimerase